MILHDLRLMLIKLFSEFGNFNIDKVLLHYIDGTCNLTDFKSAEQLEERGTPRSFEFYVDNRVIYVKTFDIMCIDFIEKGIRLGLKYGEICLCRC